MAYCPFLSTIITGETPTYIECVESLCQVWDNQNSRCGAKSSDTIIHLHSSHFHPSAHTCLGSKTGNEYKNTCGSAAKAQLISLASVLINEFINNEDMDGNSKVYGFDFMIDDKDADKPPILTDIEGHRRWPDPCCKITWQEYQDWLDNPDDADYDPFQNGTCNDCV